MMIAKYTPDLTAAEAHRFWMPPVKVCRLASIGENSDPKNKKLLNTLSDRGHVPFVKSGDAKTSPRLYSLESAIMLRTISEIIADGRTYVYATAVAELVRRGLVAATEHCDDIIAFETDFGTSRVLFSGVDEDGTPATAKWVRRDTPRNGWALSYSFIDGGYMIFRICLAYADFWAADLAKRGEAD